MDSGHPPLLAESGPKKGKFQEFQDFRASGGPERPPTAPTGSGVTAWVLRTSGNRFPIDCCHHSFQKLIFHSDFGPGGCVRAKDMLYDCAEGPKKGKFQEFRAF